MAARISAWMAIIGGVLLALADGFINWGQWQWWPWWLVDFVVAALLIAGGVATLRGAPIGRTLLGGAWGFAIGMGWMSLAGNIEVGTDPGRAERVAGHYIALLIFGLSYSLLGFVLSLRRNPS